MVRLSERNPMSAGGGREQGGAKHARVGLIKVLSLDKTDGLYPARMVGMSPIGGTTPSTTTAPPTTLAPGCSRYFDITGQPQDCWFEIKAQDAVSVAVGDVFMALSAQTRVSDGLGIF